MLSVGPAARMRLQVPIPPKVTNIGLQIFVITVRGICKEMLVIPVNRVVDPRRIIGKMEGRGGGKALGR
jgi:hypothetical protein